jgi:hypothetical protein
MQSLQVELIFRLDRHETHVLVFRRSAEGGTPNDGRTLQ